MLEYRTVFFYLYFIVIFSQGTRLALDNLYYGLKIVVYILFAQCYF